mmetsp:Transcript_6806/g.15521  ORF Transcript_6806/g.15521 Transcript_6806/m.15521 type:complete len:245 (+) Transcript_6806:1360-2094(+)
MFLFALAFFGLIRNPTSLLRLGKTLFILFALQLNGLVSRTHSLTSARLFFLALNLISGSSGGLLFFLAYLLLFLFLKTTLDSGLFILFALQLSGLGGRTLFLTNARLFFLALNLTSGSSSGPLFFLAYLLLFFFLKKTRSGLFIFFALQRSGLGGCTLFLTNARLFFLALNLTSGSSSGPLFFLAYLLLFLFLMTTLGISLFIHFALQLCTPFLAEPNLILLALNLSSGSLFFIAASLLLLFFL